MFIYEGKWNTNPTSLIFPKGQYGYLQIQCFISQFHQLNGWLGVDKVILISTIIPMISAFEMLPQKTAEPQDSMPSLEVIRTLPQSSLAGKACIYIYIYICIYIHVWRTWVYCIIYIYICLNTNTLNLYIFISLYLEIFISLYHIFISMSMPYPYPYLSLSLYTYIYIHIYICSLDPFCSGFQSEERAQFKAAGCRSMRSGLHEVVCAIIFLWACLSDGLLPKLIEIDELCAQISWRSGQSLEVSRLVYPVYYHLLWITSVQLTITTIASGHFFWASHAVTLSLGELGRRLYDRISVGSPWSSPKIWWHVAYCRKCWLRTCESSIYI